MSNLFENKPKALLFVLSCVGLWAFIPIASRLGQQSLDNFQFLFWSSILSFIVLGGSTILAKKQSHFLRYSSRDLSVAIFLGFLGTFLYYLLLYFAYARATGLEVLSLQYTWPIFIVLFSIPILKEKLTNNSVVASVLGFVGVILVLTKGELTHIYLGNILVDLVVLLAAAVFGLFSVLSKKVHFEPFTATTLFFLSATAFSLISNLVFSELVIPTLESIVPILVNGALINGISYILWLQALKNAQASYVAPFVFLTPIVAAFLMIIFFDEIFLPIYAAGFVLVLVSGYISQINRRKL